jgi:thiol-disulfide isomerase/thioredoxin
MKKMFFDRAKIRGLVIFCALALVFVFQSAAFAQTKKEKGGATGGSKKSVELNLPKVTQVDEIAFKNLLKREGENSKPLLINFWATWCDPCRAEFPDLVKINEDYKGKIDFITISLDELSEIDRDVPKFLAEMKATMPAYLLKTDNEEAAINSVYKDWSGGLPFTILFNGKGEIAYSRQGIIKLETVRAELEKVMVKSIADIIVTPQILNLPMPERNVYTYEKGVETAKKDTASGKLKILYYGLRPVSANESVINAALKKKYSVEINDIGCGVPQGFDEYAKGYNEISIAEIKRRFGANFMEKAAESIAKRN